MPKSPAKAKKELSEILKTMDEVWQLQGQLIQSAKKKLTACSVKAGTNGATKSPGRAS